MTGLGPDFHCPECLHTAGAFSKELAITPLETQVPPLPPAAPVLTTATSGDISDPGECSVLITPAPAPTSSLYLFSKSQAGQAPSQPRAVTVYVSPHPLEPRGPALGCLLLRLPLPLQLRSHPFASKDKRRASPQGPLTANRPVLMAEKSGERGSSSTSSRLSSALLSSLRTRVPLGGFYFPTSPLPPTPISPSGSFHANGLSVASALNPGAPWLL